MGLFDGYKNQSGGNQPKPKPVPQNVKQEEDSNLVDTVIDGVVNFPGQVIKAFTGEDKDIEFENVPELTQNTDIGFIESIAPSLKLMFARDDFSKAEIIANTFKKDKRFGGVFTDKFNNPMIVWNNNPFYVNKPGLTEQDIGTFVGEVIKFLPASKLVNQTRGVKGKIGTGLPSYTATELAGEGIERFMAPQTAKAKNQTATDILSESGKMGAIATGVDVVTPPFLRIPSEIVKGTVRAGAKVAGKEVPKFAQKQIKQTSKYDLSSGQAQADLEGGIPTANKMNPDLQEEEMFRFAQEMDPKFRGQSVIRAFDNKQMQAIRNDAIELADTFGTGEFGKKINQVDDAISANIDTSSMIDIKNIIASEADQLKNIAKKGYKEIELANDVPFVSIEGLKNLRKTFDRPNVTLSPIKQRNLPKTNDILNTTKETLDGFIKNGKSIDFRKIQELQSDVNTVVLSAERGSQDAFRAGQLKGIVDNFVFNGIKKGFITGNDNIINTLKKSKDAYRKYIQLSGKGGNKNKRAMAILRNIVDKDLDPKALVNQFIGHTKFNPSPVMKTVLDTIKKNIPEEKRAEVFALIKDAVLERAFSGKGKSDITRTNIVNNFNEIFERNAFFVNQLFTPKEISKIKKFRKDVIPTLFAEIKSNPSGTSYTFLAAMQRAGLLNFAKLTQAVIPFVPDMIREAQGVIAQNRAIDLTKNYIMKSRQPILIESELQALLTEPKQETVQDDNDAIPNFVKDLSQSARKKILEVGDFE